MGIKPGKALKVILAAALMAVFGFGCSNTSTSVSSDTDIDSQSLATPVDSEADQDQVEPAVDEAVRAYYAPPLPVTSDDPMAICNLFPDPNFAYWVAKTFERNMDDPITFEELSGYTGQLDLGIGRYTYNNGNSYRFKDLTGIGYFTGATGLDFCKNDIAEIPGEIGNCINLREIRVSKAYHLITISPEIGCLVNLETFSAGLTSIEYLPDEICELYNLKTLIIAATHLREIPEDIGNLYNLEYLDVHSTEIDHLPESICNLRKLVRLDISHNPRITALPYQIGNLTSLEYFNLFNCDVRYLPRSMQNMVNLRYLNVYDNYNLDEEYKDWLPSGVNLMGSRRHQRLPEAESANRPGFLSPIHRTRKRG